MTLETTAPSADVSASALVVGIDLGSTRWVCAFTVAGGKVREKTVQAGDVTELVKEFERAKAAFKLPPDAPVHSIHEAGRDGFWLHRKLVELNVDNVVVDPGSIPRDGRGKHAKTDRLDARSLVLHRLDHLRGQRRIAVVKVLPVEVEDLRHLERERVSLRDARGALVSEISSLLATQGIKLTSAQFPSAADVASLAGPLGALGPHLRARLGRALEHLAFLDARRSEVEAEMNQAVGGRPPPKRTKRHASDTATASASSDGSAPGSTAAAESPSGAAVAEPLNQKAREQIALLTQVVGIGPISSRQMVLEAFSWRAFENRERAGALIGAVNVPHSSDTKSRDRGISKGGNARLRSTLVEVAWLWLRYQPDSAITKWYQSKWGSGQKRGRLAGVVAVARKLFIALWRYVDQGVLPDGARLR